MQTSAIHRSSIYSLLQRNVGDMRSSGLVVAVTSAHSGSGVTYLSRLLAECLNSDLPGGAVLVDCRALSQEPAAALREFVESEGTAPGLRVNGGWRGSPALRRAYIGHLRERYSYVVLDCPSITESGDVLGLSTVVDGIISVVEANRTKKSQIKYLERAIQQSGGRLLGHVLNKRTYLLPEWLNTRLERLGI